MDHSNHGMSTTHNGADMNHGDMGHAAKCKMNMLFTWEWENTCVVYKWWHVTTFPQFLLTLIAIASLTAGYEFIKALSAKWEANTIRNLVPTPSNTLSSHSQSFKLKRSLIYGFQVSYSFMLMLIFMTYNGWYMIAVTIGAIFGHYWWGDALDRSMACH